MTLTVWSAPGILADMPLALTNVCFEGKNRHDAGVTPFPLMTQTDYRDPSAVVSVGPKPAMLREEDLGL
jgi:hypothetical protein